MRVINALALSLYLSAAGLLFLPGHACAAATILLWPIDPWLGADMNATELWIENQGNSATTMQVRIVRWTQEGGYERYQAQQDVVASPPILRIDRGSKQLIRLIKQTSAPAGVEKAYRIIIDEIPQPNDPSTPKLAINVQMRYSLPLFVYGTGIRTQVNAANHAEVDPQRLRWRMVVQEGKPAVEVTNSGSVHLRLSQVTVQQGGQKYKLGEGLLGYVLPGQFRRWSLPSGVSRPTELRATINARDAKWHAAPGN
ncbi:molecular chaperone [Superficieibacter electus]|uniref:Molecular chaperone n=1 Tax=Superficieibacter electus TaxID=2022662 RepID=A0A2P5GP72_9ENTR|nr:molecular chaperone [Superficieibacter electus]POP44986.1 molecular chaperone [Superficieibacter electus]POP48373.1 molecular chaperone [Superficieibacter electus]